MDWIFSSLSCSNLWFYQSLVQMCLLIGTGSQVRDVAHGPLVDLNSFGAKLPKIAYCYITKQFKHYSKLSIIVVTILDFGTFFGCRLYGTERVNSRLRSHFKLLTVNLPIVKNLSLMCISCTLFLCEYIYRWTNI